MLNAPPLSPPPPPPSILKLASGNSLFLCFVVMKQAEESSTTNKMVKVSLKNSIRRMQVANGTKYEDFLRMICRTFDMKTCDDVTIKHQDAGMYINQNITKQFGEFILNIVCYIFSSNIKVLSESFFFLSFSDNDLVTVLTDEELRFAFESNEATLRFIVCGKFQEQH